MSNITLYIGTRNLSSWSLRAWLMLKQTSVNFNTVLIELSQPDTREKILQISPAGKVPVLKYEESIIWDSLAIAEFLAEKFPDKNLWPRESGTRALARSISCEMHSGFAALREALPMQIKNRFENYHIPQNAKDDIQRIVNIWEECRKLNVGIGQFLFGDFTISDAMFAPVATRFVSYNVPLSKITEDYVNTIMHHPAMQEWCNQS